MRAVNLLPPEPKRSRRTLSGFTQIALVAPFVVVGLLAAGYLLSTSKVNAGKATLDALRSELVALPAPPPQPQTNPQLAVERDQRIAALSSALRTRLAWDRILRQISTVLPGDVWLTALSSSGSAATSATPAAAPSAGSLNINGYTYSADAVARLLSRLAVVPALQGVQLNQSDRTIISGRAVYSFSIQTGVRAGETG